jgi:transposase InsO family protein
VTRPVRKRGPYRKAKDGELLGLIRRLVDERPTYGYRRITRLVNRQHMSEGRPTINTKRVLRIMQENHLTLEPYTGRRCRRTHDGAVTALTSNVRWCSDHFELSCRNGELVRVLFAIDACDREIIAWSAATAGVSGEMVRDLMVACVERRFTTSRAPHPIEWLSDSGSEPDNERWSVRGGVFRDHVADHAGDHHDHRAGRPSDRLPASTPTVNSSS